MTIDDAPSDLLIEALEGIHKWSMSNDEHVAVTGRCLKEFYEPFDNFEKRECDRGIHRGIVIYGIIHAMGVIAATTALSGCRDGYHEKAIQSATDLFTDVVNSVFNAKKNDRVDRKDT